MNWNHDKNGTPYPERVASSLCAVLLVVALFVGICVVASFDREAASVETDGGAVRESRGQVADMVREGATK